MEPIAGILTVKERCSKIGLPIENCMYLHMLSPINNRQSEFYFLSKSQTHLSKGHGNLPFYSSTYNSHSDTRCQNLMKHSTFVRSMFQPQIQALTKLVGSLYFLNFDPIATNFRILLNNCPPNRF